MPKWAHEKATKICRRMRAAGKLRGSMNDCVYGMLNKLVQDKKK